MDFLLARVAELMSECSRFWGCDDLDTDVKEQLIDDGFYFPSPVSDEE